MKEYFLNIRPRRIGITEATIQEFKATLLQDKTCGILCHKPDVKTLKRYQDRLMELGVETTSEEVTTTRMEPIWTDDIFEPYISGFKTEIKFNGYILKMKEI